MIRPRRTMEPTITALTGATTTKLAELGVQGVTSGQDLSIITYDDVTAILPGSGLLTRRKLAHVGKYIGRGQTVTPATTIQDIVLYLKQPMTQGTAALPPIVPHIYPPDPTRGALLQNKDRNTADRKKKFSFGMTNNKKGRWVKVMRRTHKENPGISQTSVTISMKDSDNSNGGDGNDDDDSTSGQDEESTTKKTPVRKKKKQKKARRNPISRRGCTGIKKTT
jgi:hypothetical protein